MKKFGKKKKEGEEEEGAEGAEGEEGAEGGEEGEGAEVKKSHPGGSRFAHCPLFWQLVLSLSFL